MKESFLTDPELLRFMSKVKKIATGCWLWSGPLDRDGYGSFYLRRVNRRAHRVGFFLKNGPIKEGLVVDHVCSTRACVNPDHLRLVTARENSLENSNSVPAKNAKKTHCKNGHPFDRKYGKQRYCSACQSQKTSRLRKRWRKEDKEGI